MVVHKQKRYIHGSTTLIFCTLYSWLHEVLDHTHHSRLKRCSTPTTSIDAARGELVSEPWSLIVTQIANVNKLMLR